MKKTVFLSLIAGAMIFAGCGGGGSSGGGSSTSGGSTSGGSTSGGTTSGGTTSGGTVTDTFLPYVYPQDKLGADKITIDANGNWSVVNDDRNISKVSTVEMNYDEALAFCGAANMPSPNDLFSLSRAHGLTAAWAKDQFYAIFGSGINNPDMIGQDIKTEKKYVACISGTSIERKHTISTDNVTKVITDDTTGLQWSPFKVINKGNKNDDANVTNQFTFPIAGAPGNFLTAAEYCSQMAPVGTWHLPNAGELRSIMFLDGTTPIIKLDNLNPTVIWTSTTNAQGKNLAINLNRHSVHSFEDGDAKGVLPGTDADSANAYHYVTCVKAAQNAPAAP